VKSTISILSINVKPCHRARCASAAPTYFEHYRHPATNRIYRDGSMESSNPILFADSERKLLWQDTRGHSRDILVSLGAGYSSDYNGDADQDSTIPKALRPLGQMRLVARLATLRLVQQNTSNCQEEWVNFKLSLAEDPQLLTKCHRVNVPYGRGQTLCKLDEVSKIGSTQVEASAFLRQMSKFLSPSIQERTSAKVDTIAHQLVASLFYFHILDAYDLNDYKYHCRGLFYCRLSTSCTQAMTSLINNGRPRFRVYDEEHAEGGEMVELGSRGWNYNDFSISASFDVLTYVKKGARVQVTLAGEWGSGVWEDISGFPKKFKRRERNQRM
jgi:hypothetical protein